MLVIVYRMIFIFSINATLYIEVSFFS